MYRSSAPFAWRSSKIDAKRKIGVIEAVTRVWNAPSGFENKVPYFLALIKLDHSKVFAEIVDSHDVKIGMKVESCVRKVFVDSDDGIIQYGVKFKVIK